MRRLRQTAFLRLWAAALLASVGVGLAAPVAAAVRPADGAVPLALAAVPPSTPEQALAASGGAATPEAFAEALAGALHAALGDAAPPAEAILHEVYGRLLRALQEEFGASAVVIASAPVGPPVGAPGSAEPPRCEVVNGPGSGAITEADEAARPSPRRLRPAVQPLGP